MNLSTIKAILEKAPLSDAFLSSTNNIVHNLVRFKTGIESLEPIPSFQTSIASLKESALYGTSQDSVAVANTPTAEQLKDTGNAVLLGAGELLKTLEATLPATPPESIFVTLPANRALSSVVTVMEQLEDAIGPLIRDPEVGGDLEVTSWETGSLVLILCLKTATAVFAVSRILQAAATAYHEMQQGRLIGQQIGILKIKKESLKDVQAAQAELLKAVVEREAKAVETEIFQKREPERLERVKHSIRTLAELLDRGTRITPSLGMPEDQKAKFPDPDRLTGSAIRQIEDTPTSESSANE